MPAYQRMSTPLWTPHGRGTRSRNFTQHHDEQTFQVVTIAGEYIFAHDALYRSDLGMLPRLCIKARHAGLEKT